MSAPAAFGGVSRYLTNWAVNRSLAPVSVTGISLALGLCAAAWFTAGTRPDDLRGGLTLCASYLAWRAARSLARQGRAAQRPAGTAAQRPAGTAAAMAELCGAASEYAVYAGLAVGGYEAHWGATWQVAVGVMIVMTVRKTVVACSGPGAGDPGTGNLVGRALLGLLACPPGARTALIALVTPIWGARTTLMALLEWGIIAASFAVTGRGPYRAAVAGPSDPAGSAVLVQPAVAVESAVPVASPAMAESDGWVESAAWVELPAPAESPVAGESPGPVEPAEQAVASAALAGAGSGGGNQPDAPITLLGAAEPAVAFAGDARMVGEAEPTLALDLLVCADLPRQQEPAPRTRADPQAVATMVACRDDGMAAAWLGKLVRGQFVPLPPALAGLAATCFLAWLGMRNLPGVLVLTPLVVMLLAAPGSSHPHDGLLDWLTPAVLLLGQLVYVAAVGFSFQVPAPVTYALCALIALRYVELAISDRREAGSAGGRLGWEGRMLIVGAGAMIGIPTVAYLALAAYLVVLMYTHVMTRWLSVREGGRR